MNHIYLIRLVVLKRPGFQSQKFGMPTSDKQQKKNFSTISTAPKLRNPQKHRNCVT